MQLSADVKARIDALDYEELLRRWRTAQMGDVMFQGESGEYWSKRMAELQSSADHVGASKRIGWRD